MKKLIPIVKWAIMAVVIIIGAVVGYLKLALPNIDVPADLTVEVTPERVERGKYLANHVNLCMDCHATRDFGKFAGPPKSGTLGAGGERFDESMGFPGVFYSRNITPHGIGDWSDGEIYRAITSGITKNNEVIFPVMPWPAYSKMATEDIYAIIAYLRSLDPVVSENKPSKAIFPVSLIKKHLSKARRSTTTSPKSNELAYGAYLTNAAGCVECHSKMDDKGNKIPGTEYGGGMNFPLPGFGVVSSANLTPEPSTGLTYSRDQFIQLFKNYADSTYVPHDVSGGEFQTMMPWIMYAGMTEEDLGAIYTYLQSLDPIENAVTRFVSQE